MVPGCASGCVSREPACQTAPPRRIASSPSVLPAPGGSREPMLFCGVDRPCVACASCVPDVVAPWRLYRSKDQDTQSEFELRSMRIEPASPKSEFAFYRDPLLKSTLNVVFEFR